MELKHYLKDEFAVNGDLYRQAIRHLSSEGARCEILSSSTDDVDVLFKTEEWSALLANMTCKRTVFTWLAEVYWALFTHDMHRDMLNDSHVNSDDKKYLDLISMKLALVCAHHWKAYAKTFDRPEVYLGGALKRLMAMRGKKIPPLKDPAFYALVINKCNAEKDDIINYVNQKIGMSF